MDEKVRSNRGAGKRRVAGDPFGNLRKQIDGLRLANTGRDQETRRGALARFVGGLSPEERKHLRGKWWKSSKAVQAELSTAITRHLGGTGGPAETLLRELRDDINRRLDGLPDPPGIGPQQSAKQWEASFVSAGLPTNDAKERAAELTKPLAESMKDFWIANGASPEMAAEMAAEDLRREKWAAVADETLPAALAAKERAARDQLRPIVHESSGLGGCRGKAA